MEVLDFECNKLQLQENTNRGFFVPERLDLTFELETMEYGGRRLEDTRLESLLANKH